MAIILNMTRFDEDGYRLAKKPMKFGNILKQANVLDSKAIKDLKCWSDGCCLNLSWKEIKQLEARYLDHKAWNLVYSPVMGELWLAYDGTCKYYCKMSESKVQLFTKEDNY